MTEFWRLIHTARSTRIPAVPRFRPALGPNPLGSIARLSLGPLEQGETTNQFFSSGPLWHASVRVQACRLRALSSKDAAHLLSSSEFIDKLVQVPYLSHEWIFDVFYANAAHHTFDEFGFGI
jgi:hypothetical protein